MTPVRAAPDAFPAYLPPTGRPLDLLTVDATWSALALPAEWGGHVLRRLGDGSGPVFHDPGLRLLTWICAPAATAGWPDASALGLRTYGPGTHLLVPGADGYHDGSRWLIPPGGPLTDTEALRGAVEEVAGPLEQADSLGPLRVCVHCGEPTRDAVLVGERDSVSGPGWRLHAHRVCHHRHLYLTGRTPPLPSERELLVKLRLLDGGRVE